MWGPSAGPFLLLNLAGPGEMNPPRCWSLIYSHPAVFAINRNHGIPPLACYRRLVALYLGLSEQHDGFWLGQ